MLGLVALAPACKRAPELPAHNQKHLAVPSLRAHDSRLPESAASSCNMLLLLCAAAAAAACSDLPGPYIGWLTCSKPSKRQSSSSKHEFKDGTTCSGVCLGSSAGNMTASCVGGAWRMDGACSAATAPGRRAESGNPYIRCAETESFLDVLNSLGFVYPQSARATHCADT